MALSISYTWSCVQTVLLYPPPSSSNKICIWTIKLFHLIVEKKLRSMLVLRERKLVSQKSTEGCTNPTWQWSRKKEMKRPIKRLLKCIGTKLRMEFGHRYKAWHFSLRQTDFDPMLLTKLSNKTCNEETHFEKLNRSLQSIETFSLHPIYYVIVITQSRFIKQPSLEGKSGVLVNINQTCIHIYLNIVIFVNCRKRICITSFIFIVWQILRFLHNLSVLVTIIFSMIL